MNFYVRKLSAGILGEQLHFVKGPFFERHILVDNDPVLLALRIHEDNPPYRLDFFMDQCIAESKSDVGHPGIIGNVKESPSELVDPANHHGIDKLNSKFEHYCFCTKILTFQYRKVLACHGSILRKRKKIGIPISFFHHLKNLYPSLKEANVGRDSSLIFQRI